MSLKVFRGLANEVSRISLHVPQRLKILPLFRKKLSLAQGMV